MRQNLGVASEHAEPAPPPDDADEHHEHPRLSEIAEAAVEAEFATGRREETVAEARAHVAVRLARMTLGFAVTVVGIVLLPLPGPGWLVIAAGLVILAQDFVWAERTLAIVRRRIPQDADGKIAPRTWAIIGLSSTATLGASVWWTMLR
jgi:uncharacterized protein (TIGR02611 family)